MAFRVRLERLILASGALGLVACATILGVNDRNLDPQADASTNPLTDGSLDTSSEGSADATADASIGSDASMGDGAAPDVTARDADVDGDASRAADAPAPDAPSMDAPSTDSPSADAPTTDGSSMDSNTTGDTGGDTGTACPDPCVLASGLNHPFLMAADSNNVYWTEFGDSQGSGNGFVKGCPVTGCGAGPTIYAQGVTNPRGIAVDSQNVYWATASYGGVTGGIWSCPIASTNCTPMLLSTANIPYGVAVDATYVYWVDVNDSTVHSVAKVGADASAVLSDAGDGLVYAPFQCVVDGPFLYFMDYDENAFRLPVTGGALAYIGSGNNGSQYGSSFGITTDTTSVYFGGNGIVQRADKNVPDSGVPISTSVPLPDGLAYDSVTGMMYWSNWGSGNTNDGTIGKMLIDGGSAQVLASALNTPESVKLSGNYVLWISNGMLDTTGTGSTLPSTGAVLRRAK